MPAQWSIEGEMKTENGVCAQKEKPVQWTEEEVARLKDALSRKLRPGLTTSVKLKRKSRRKTFWKHIPLNHSH